MKFSQFLNQSPSLKEVVDEDSLSAITKSKPLEKIYSDTDINLQTPTTKDNSFASFISSPKCNILLS